MNRRIEKLLALLIAVAMMTVMMAGCRGKKDAKEEPVTDGETTAIVENNTEEQTPTVETTPALVVPAPGSITYEEYQKLDVAVQQAYFESFATAEDFFAWRDASKAEGTTATEPAETTDPEKDNQKETVPAETENGMVSEGDVEDWEWETE